MQRNIISKLNSESLPIFAFCFSMLISATLATYVMVPKWQELQKVKLQLNKYSTLISSENGLAQIKNEIENKNKILNDKLEKISGVLSNSQDLSGYIELLIDKAKVNDIRFVKMQPQPEIKNQDFTFYPILLDMSTTYNALGHFISSLEKLPHYFKIERISIDSGESAKIDVKLMVTSIIPTKVE